MESIKVLIVDDESGMRLGVKRVLEKYNLNIEPDVMNLGFNIDLAETGEEALEKIVRNKPEIIILDHKLPGIQGIDLLDELKKKNLDILTIMVTAYASIEVAISATKRGAYDFLAKPFTPDELKHIINKGAKHLILKKKAQKLAEEKKMIRFEFISVLAHELKSPLAAVEGYLRLMDERMVGENISGYDSMIKRSRIRLDGMRKMILDLLDLTRIESGKVNRELKTVNIIDIIKDSMEMVATDAKRRGIKIELNHEKTIDFYCDTGELEIIFNNFISNGIKYNKDNGKLTITVKEEADFILIDFADTGIGMSKEDSKRLFGEFVRIKNEKTRNITGSGLGLSIVKKLITYYNGSVDVQSEFGKGSVFTIKLNKQNKRRKE